MTLYFYHIYQYQSKFDKAIAKTTREPFLSGHSVVRKDTRQSPTLARPVAPLAACVQRQKLVALAVSVQGSES